MKVTLISWREGLQKIALTKLIVSMCELDLGDAKNKTDSLLDNQPVSFLFNTPEIAQEFFQKAKELGANAEIST